MHASHIPTGGMAVKFFSSTVIKLWSSEAEANAIKAGVQVGDKVLEQKVGRPVNWIIDYNKLGPPNLSGQYDFYYQGDNVGIDRVGETLDVAEMYGLVEKGGAWYTVEGERLQGRAKAVQHLRSNPDVVEALTEKINAKS
jgi:recombination protein RecA